MFQAINESVLPLVTYSFGVVNWNEEELKGYDIQIRKMLNMYRAFETNSDTDRLYLPRECGGRGPLSVWDSFQATTSRIAHSLKFTNNHILEQTIDVDERSHYSNINRSKKYEAYLNPEFPNNFMEKPIMAQARIKAKVVKEAIIKTRSQSNLSNHSIVHMRACSKKVRQT